MKKTLKKLAALGLALALAVTVIPVSADTAYADDDFRISEASSLAKVTSLKAKDRDNDEIELGWKPVEGASGYEVQRYSVKDSKWILLGRSDDNDFDVENLLSASVYSFRVRAFAQHADGDVVYGNYSKTYKTCTRPNDVNNLRASEKSSSSITLKWNSVKRASKYQVYIYDRNSEQWERLITTSKTSYKVSGLNKDTSYKFRVRPYRDANDSRYYGDFEDISIRTASSASAASSDSITKSKAKSIALNHAGVSAANADFIRVELDYDDGIKVYEIEFDAGDFEYEYEINAKSGKIRDYDKEYRWD